MGSLGRRRESLGIPCGVLIYGSPLYGPPLGFPKNDSELPKVLKQGICLEYLGMLSMVLEPKTIISSPIYSRHIPILGYIPQLTTFGSFGKAK